MRTFQQDTVLHMVTERSSSDYVAGGDKGRAMVSKLLLNSKGIYESTEREVSGKERFHGPANQIPDLGSDGSSVHFSFV